MLLKTIVITTGTKKKANPYKVFVSIASWRIGRFSHRQLCCVS